MNPTPVIPDAIINVTKLREEALELSQSALNTKITLHERVVIAIIVSRDLGLNHQTLIATIREDLQTWGIPKFTALASWLAPYSLVSQYPATVIRVARYLLGHTRQEEEESIDWVAIRKSYPQL